MATKQDVELEKIKFSSEKFHAVCDVLKHLISAGAVLFAIRIIFWGLEPFLSSNPDTIKSIAVIIEKINFSNITGYILAAGTGSGWYIERRGKKRAIREKGRYQKIVESEDDYRSSSGLTKSGETPRGEE
jgi:hypothetical protein